MGLKDAIYQRYFMKEFDSGMKRAAIAWNHTSPNQIYISDSPSYCWVGKSEAGVRPQVSDWMTCRESFIDHLRNQISNNNVTTPKNRVCIMMGRSVAYNSIAKVKTNFQKRFLGQMKRGVRIVNVLEAHLGWTRTRMFDVWGHEKRKQHGAAYLITGPSRWMRAPQLLSLYTLLLRFGRFEAFESVNTLQGFMDISNKITSKRVGGSFLTTDRRFMSRTRDSWLPLLEEMDFIYKGRTLRRNYLRKYLADGDTGFSEGISRLASGRTRDKELRKIWRQTLTRRKAKS